MLFVEDGKMGECLLDKSLHSKAWKPGWRQRHTQTSVWARAQVWRRCLCVFVCVSLSFSCTRSTLWAVQLLFDCAPVFGLSSFCLCVLLFYLFCESLPASLPVVPPDGGEQRGSCRRREVNALEPQQETDLNVFTAGRTYFLLLYTVCALCLCHIQRLCLFIHRATGVPGHMERHS